MNTLKFYVLQLRFNLDLIMTLSDEYDTIKEVVLKKSDLISPQKSLNS